MHKKVYYSIYSSK